MSESTKKTLVLVVTHKVFDSSIVPSEGYRVIKVGSKLSDEEAQKLGYLVDDVGDNIASENPFYCELTAQYWAWKNLSHDIEYVGISHYRRYFFDYDNRSNDWRRDIIPSSKIEKILQNHKVIMSFPSVKVPGFSMLYKNKKDDDQDKHWVIIRDIIRSKYPEMYPYFEKIMYGRKTIYGNMLIAQRKVFDAYCEWVFDVLKQYDEEIARREEDRIPRVDGYLAEPLLLIWMTYMLKTQDIYYMEVRNIEQESFLDYKKNLFGRAFGRLRHNRASLVLLQKCKVAFLLIKRRKR